MNRMKEIAGALLALMIPALAAAQVSVSSGPTPIPGGTASGVADITLQNELMAVAFAVTTPGPWGVARGGIVDVAVVRDGLIGPDRASLVDFMPDDWGPWPTSYQRVSVLESGPRRALIRTERDWGDVELVSTWQLDAGADTLHVITRMHNRGKQPLPGILSGYVMWPEGGHLFGVPGSDAGKDGIVRDALADWSAAYDEDWVLGLHAPFADRSSDGSRNRYRRHDLGPGETREFEAWLQVGPHGDLAPLVARQIRQSGLKTGHLAGRVSNTDGAAVPTPAIVIEARGENGWRPFFWALGHDGQYGLDLPTGRYRIHASAQFHADSRPVEIDVSAGSSRNLDFTDLGAPGEIRLRVRSAATGEPLDARIFLEGEAPPLVEWFGRTTFFTGLDGRGELQTRIAPGQHRIGIDSAAGVLSPLGRINTRVPSGGSLSLDAVIDRQANPTDEGWYSGDLHHHSDVLDGFSEPADVLRSQLAAGLDFAFLSDHDSVQNNAALQQLARLRGTPFIAGTEFSPSWGHFNAYPLDPDATISIDIGQSTVQQIFAEGRRLGARVIAVNHPFISYGYFRSVAAGQTPGGYSADFDLVEINGAEGNTATVQRAFELWNSGQRAYLTAGSDVHDVWQEHSGEARMYVHPEGPPDVLGFVAALKAGRAYATQGPLIFPSRMFGSSISLAPDQRLELGFELQSVNGLARVQLIERGGVIESRDLAGTTQRVPVSFSVLPVTDTWYSLIVTDREGRSAWTNPVWVQTGKH